MEQKNFKASLRRTVAIPVIALVLLAAVLLLETQYLNHSMQWVDHTDQVIGTGQRLIKSITDLESDLRGYLSSGREEFLLPNNQAKSSIASQFAALNQLISDNPAQQARLAGVRSRFDEWLSYEEHRVELRRSTQSRLDPSLQGKQLMDSVRAEHLAFIATEDRLRTDRLRTARIAFRLVTFTCVLLTLAIGVFLAIFTRRRIRMLAASFQESLDTTEKNENRLRLALDAGSMATWDLNLKSGQNIWNDEMYRLLGYEPQSTPGSVEIWAQRVFPEDFPKAEAMFRTSLEQGVDLRSEYRVLAKNNEVRWVEARGRSECDAKGNVLRSYGVLMDITERKQAEEDSKNSFLTLSNFVPQLVWMCTPDGLNTYFNQRWVDYTGLTLEESYGRGWNTPFHPDDQQLAWDAWNRAVQSGGEYPYSVECRLRAADGSYRRFLIRGEPMRDLREDSPMVGHLHGYRGPQAGERATAANCYGELARRPCHAQRRSPLPLRQLCLC